MTAESNNIFLHVLDEFTAHIVTPRGPDVFSTDLEKGFLPIYRFLHVLCALQRDQRTKIANWDWQPTISEPSQVVLNGRSSKINELFSSICTHATTFAELNVTYVLILPINRPARLISLSYSNQVWIQEEKICITEFRSYSAYLDRGRGILAQAQQLIQDISQLEHTPLSTPNTQSNPNGIIAANCLILKLGILRLFSHPAWQIDTLARPPEIAEFRVQEFAASALNHLEKRIGEQAGLESVSYLSHLMALVLEIGDVQGRKRVLKLLERIRHMGFRVAEMCIGDAELVWKTFGPRAETGKSS